MNTNEIGLPYYHSPHGFAYDAWGNILEVKEYKNGGKYVRVEGKQVGLGTLPEMTDEDVKHFRKVFYYDTTL